MPDKIITDLLVFRRTATDLTDQVDRIANNVEYAVTKESAEYAKIKINAAVKKVTGEKKLSNRLCQTDINRILNLLYDLGRGEKQVIQFQLTDCETGIQEMFSGKIFYYE